MTSKKKIMNNSVFGKSIENVWKHRDVKLATVEKRRNYLVLEPNYRNAMFFKETLLAIEMEKAQVLINKPVYLRLSILQLNKTVIYEF